MNDRDNSNVIAPALVRQAQAGNEEAFNELYQRSAAMIYRTIFSMVKDEDTAWDIHQNSYILAYRSLQKLEKPEAFLPWLRRIAVNEAVKTLKKEQPLRFTDLADEDGEEPQFAETRDSYQPEIALDRQESARLVREILEKLPQKQKLIVGMYYYEECSISEIAETLQVSQSTVKTHLRLGRMRVEAEVRRLEQEGVKLYGMPPMAFLVFLMRNLKPARLAGNGAAQAVLGDAAVHTPVVLTAKAAGTGFFHSALGKASAVILSAAVMLAGGVLAYHAMNNKLEARMGDHRPTEPIAVTEHAPASSEVPEETQTQQPTESAPDASDALFPWSECNFDESILAVVCNAPFAEDSAAPSVVWNEGSEDLVRIYPRYAGSTVSASRIDSDDNGHSTIDPPSYSTVCAAGDCIGAALERPEAGPAWVVTVQAPDGRAASWVLEYNSEFGTPHYEFLSVGDDPGDFWNSPQSACYFAEHILRQIGYCSDYDLWDENSDESNPLFSLGNVLHRSAQRASEETEDHPEAILLNDCFEGDGAAWLSSECWMEGGSYCLDAAWLSDHYMNEIDIETFVPGVGSARLPLAEKVARQAALFAKERYIGFRGKENNYLADEGEELHFDLHGVLVYNPTLSAKTVSITVNGQDAGLFTLREGDFFTWIPLDYSNQPADAPVRVETRVTETHFGTPEQAILKLWPDLTGNLSRSL